MWGDTMTNKQFKNYLLNLAKKVGNLKDSLQHVVNELDVELITEYDDDIDTILFDLNNVKGDCEFLVRIMRTGGYID